ncbi:hypothetical protein PHISP_07651 [Aspergillus sp. HF37]|nr:hypothetical protein PHISP_07651 [Aspergillus sp. HF37]
MMLMSLFSRPSILSWLSNARAVSAISATALLSVFPHQEPRFLLPCVPLLLSCFRLNKSRLLLATWVIFNAAMGFLMGVYHQGGVVPTQLAIPSIVSSTTPSSFGTHQVSATVFWWKTYSPPRWLLGDNTNIINDNRSTPLTLDIDTRDLMGISGSEMIQNLNQTVPPCQPTDTDTDTSVFIVAPRSATFLDQYTETASSDLRLRELWSFPKHLNLDDLDFGSDGVVATLRRVVGRRGLSVWAVRRAGCA